MVVVSQVLLFNQPPSIYVYRLQEIILIICSLSLLIKYRLYHIFREESPLYNLIDNKWLVIYLPYSFFLLSESWHYTILVDCIPEKYYLCICLTHSAECLRGYLVIVLLDNVWILYRVRNIYIIEYQQLRSRVLRYSTSYLLSERGREYLDAIASIKLSYALFL